MGAFSCTSEEEKKKRPESEGRLSAAWKLPAFFELNLSNVRIHVHEKSNPLVTGDGISSLINYCHVTSANCFVKVWTHLAHLHGICI